MEQIKKKRSSYQKKYRDKIKDKPRRNYYKEPRLKLNRSLTYKHEGTKYALLSIAHWEGKAVMCEDVYSTFFISGLDFLEKFEIKSYQSKERQIDLFFKNIKKEIEQVYPGTMIVFGYATQFSAEYKKSRNGVMVDLHMKVKKEEFTNNVLEKHKDELIRISLDIKKYIKKNLEVD